MRLRLGIPLESDLKMINTRVITKLGPEELPKNLKYGTYHNKSRDAIHATLFEKMVRQSKDGAGFVIVICDKLESRPSGSTKPFESIMDPKLFYETVGESDCNFDGRGRLDPVQKFYYGCELMNTMNKNVRKGRAMVHNMS